MEQGTTSTDANEHDAGVYAVISKKTGDMYIGSSCFLMRRLKTHVSNILRPNPRRTWRNLKGHSLNDIELRVIERISVEVRAGYSRSRLTLARGYDQLLERERYWIDQLRPSLNKRNTKPIVGVSIPVLEGPPPMRISSAS